jgi:hypothetical protein
VQKDEWETHAVYDQVDQVVRIYSTVPKHIRKLRSDDRAQIYYDTGDSVAAKINAADFNVLGGFKRKSKPMTAEQKEAAVARLAKAREARNDG